MLTKSQISRKFSGALGAELDRKTMLCHVTHAARAIAANDLTKAYSSLRFALAYACRLQDRVAMSHAMTAQNRLRGYARRHGITLA